MDWPSGKLLISMLQDWLHSGSTEVILHELFTPQKQIVESREQIGSCYAHHPALPFDHTCMNKAQWLLSPYVFHWGTLSAM